MKLNHDGAISLDIGLSVTIILFVACLIFAIWAFNGRSHYKNDTTNIVNAAVSQAKAQQQTSDNKAFAIAEQKPLTEYVGPQAYGTINLFYPKNWSGFVDASGNDGNPIDGYFSPNLLSTVTDDGTTNFALRLQVENSSYSSVLSTYQSEAQSGQATVTAYSLPKLPKVVGVEVVGQLQNNATGTMVILPLRAGAVEIWTEGNAYLSTFNSDILANLTFSP